MTLPRTLLAALLVTAVAHAQQPDVPPPNAAPAQKPAPIVRSTPKPSATDTTAAPKPIRLPKPGLPVVSSATATPAAKPTPPPTTPPIPAAPAAVTLNRTTIFIDPAHGGTDSGSHINDSLTEKDITLALAFKLRSLLSARGFTVILTRDSDSAITAAGQPLSLDERAGLANHARPVACLLLHATDAGRGVHLYTSELAPVPAEPATAPWLTAQAAYVPQSQRLATQLSTALTRARIPNVTAAASVRPVDSLQCPALVVELAPNDGNEDTLSDSTYQQHVAEALSSALLFWQNQAQPILRAAPPTPPTAPTPTATAPETQP